VGEPVGDHRLYPDRVIRKTPFAYSAFFVVTTNQTIGRSFPNPLGSMTLSARPANLAA